MEEKEFLKKQLKICASSRLRVDLDLLADTLIATRKKLQTLNGKEQEKRLSYTFLVEQMPPATFRGCKRQFLRLLKFLSKNDFLQTEGDYITDIGPRLYPHYKTLQAAPEIAERIGLINREGRDIVLYCLAPFRVVLGARHNKSIYLTVDLIAAVLEDFHGYSSKEAYSFGKKAIRIFVGRGLLIKSSTAKAGVGSTYIASPLFKEILKNVNSSLYRVQNARIKNDI